MNTSLDIVDEITCPMYSTYMYVPRSKESRWRVCQIERNGDPRG